MTRTDLASLLSQFYSINRKVGRLSEINGILRWDQSSNLPLKGLAARSEQVTLLQELSFGLLFGDHYSDIVNQLTERSGELSPIDLFNLNEAKKEISNIRLLGREFLAKKSYLVSSATSAWLQASDYNDVAKNIASLVPVWREEAQTALGARVNLYDFFVDIFCPGFTWSDVQEVNAALRACFGPVQYTAPNPLSVDSKKQSKLILKIWHALGFETEGVISLGQNPETFGCGKHDQRLRYRINPGDFDLTLSGFLHECGHAIYNRSLNEEFLGSATGVEHSTMLQEATARFFQIFVRNSPMFVEFISKELGISPSRLQAASVRQAGSLNRIDANQRDYYCHLAIRVELEEALLNEKITAFELKHAWDEMHLKVFGKRPENDQQGILQEASWFYGTLGYFNAYLFGDLFAVAIYQMCYDSLAKMKSLDDLGKLSDFLSNAIFSLGKRYRHEKLADRRLIVSMANKLSQYLSDPYPN